MPVTADNGRSLPRPASLSRPRYPGHPRSAGLFAVVIVYEPKVDNFASFVPAVENLLAGVGGNKLFVPRQCSAPTRSRENRLRNFLFFVTYRAIILRS